MTKSTLTAFLLSFAILAIAAWLRLPSLAAYAPFDWDQNRDYHEVAKIAAGKPTLIGPVAKGEGGFFLGPLYYYLVVPAYVLTHGHPLALPITSVILDLAALLALLALGFFLKNPRFGYLLAFFWAVSPAVIAAARISWNVALLPLWFFAYLWFLSRSSFSPRWLLFGGFLAGLSWHIHAALIPLAPVLLLARARALNLFSPKLGWLVLGYLLPLAPLFLFDLRHGGLQSQLLREQFTSQLASRASTQELLTSVLSRFGKNLSALFGGPSDLNLRLGLLGMIFLFFALVRGNLQARLAALAAFTNLLLVIGLGVVAFPEYYLAIATLSFALCITLFLSRSLLATCLALVFLGQFLLAPAPPPPAYSLGHKQALAQHISRQTTEATILYDLPFGRDSGLSILLTRAGLTLTDTSPTLYLVTEKTDQALFIKGELATDQGYFGALRLVKRDVQ